MLLDVSESEIAECNPCDIIGILGGDTVSLAIRGEDIRGEVLVLTLTPLSDFIPEPFCITEINGNEKVLRICSDYYISPSIEPLNDQIKPGYQPKAGDLMFDDHGASIIGTKSGQIPGLRKFSLTDGSVSYASSSLARLQSWSISSCGDANIEIYTRST